MKVWKDFYVKIITQQKVSNYLKYKALENLCVKPYKVRHQQLPNGMFKKMFQWF